MNFQTSLSADASGRTSPRAASGVNPSWLLGILLAALGLQNLLLWRFLGVTNGFFYPIGGAAVAAIATWIVRSRPGREWRGPSPKTLVSLGAVSLLIFLLGGEGRLFYANADWQIRDAVLHDLIVNPWPFVYRQGSAIELLRAPIGMFLVPALAGKAFGPAAADVALLVQNSLLLTLVLGLGSTLFEGAGAKLGALLVVIVFSGMDVVGRLIVWLGGGPFPDHLEQWAGIQFSSHITQAFWVPQHGLSGWVGALLFLLWREKRISLGQMYAPVPLLMLLSPLGVMGTLPFAAFAGLSTLLARRLRPSDFAVPAIASAVSLPAILYLGAAADSVGLHRMAVPLNVYVVFELLEVLVFVAGVFVLSRGRRDEMATLLLVTACLLLAPLFQLGEGMDFTMRVSIPALAILAVQVAAAISRASSTDPEQRSARRMLVAALAIGSVTGGFEIARALRFEASPSVHCSLPTAGSESVDLPHTSSFATYFAPVAALPSWMRPAAAHRVRSADEPACWDRPWQVPRFG